MQPVISLVIPVFFCYWLHLKTREENDEKQPAPDWDCYPGVHRFESRSFLAGTESTASKRADTTTETGREAGIHCQLGVEHKNRLTQHTSPLR